MPQQPRLRSYDRGRKIRNNCSEGMNTDEGSSDQWMSPVCTATSFYDDARPRADSLIVHGRRKRKRDRKAGSSMVTRSTRLDFSGAELHLKEPTSSPPHSGPGSPLQLPSPVSPSSPSSRHHRRKGLRSPKSSPSSGSQSGSSTPSPPRTTPAEASTVSSSSSHTGGTRTVDLQLTSTSTALPDHTFQTPTNRRSRRRAVPCAPRIDLSGPGPTIPPPTIGDLDVGSTESASDIAAQMAAWRHRTQAELEGPCLYRRD